MSIYDDIAESVRDDVFAAAEQLERMYVDQIDVFCVDLQPIQDEYQPELDVTEILIGAHSDCGITGWEVSLHRRDEDTSAISQELDPVDRAKATIDQIDTSSTSQELPGFTTIETVTRGTMDRIGTTHLLFYHPPYKEFDIVELLQSIYNKLISLIRSERQTLVQCGLPPANLLNPYAAPEVETDVLSQTGEQWDQSIVATEEM